MFEIIQFWLVRDVWNQWLKIDYWQISVAWPNKLQHQSCPEETTTHFYYSPAQKYYFHTMPSYHCGKLILPFSFQLMVSFKWNDLVPGNRRMTIIGHVLLSDLPHIPLSNIVRRAIQMLVMLHSPWTREWGCCLLQCWYTWEQNICNFSSLLSSGTLFIPVSFSCNHKPQTPALVFISAFHVTIAKLNVKRFS